MPSLSTKFVRASLVYLAIGFSLGALLLANKALAFYPPTWKLLPIHMEVLMMGWFVQLAAGVAFWILPRLSGPDPRGNLHFIGWAFWLVNLGIGLVILETFADLPALLLAGRLAELAGVLAFIAAAWKRVRAFGK
jgi:cbb3-type cytochrome oxidase subunit 1